MSDGDVWVTSQKSTVVKVETQQEAPGVYVQLALYNVLVHDTYVIGRYQVLQRSVFCVC